MAERVARYVSIDGSARACGVGACPRLIRPKNDPREISGLQIDRIPSTRPPWWRRQYMLIRTRLFQQCPVLRSLQEGDKRALSADAGPINGTYCRRYRDAAVATRASFNENPWELMRNNNK